MRAIVCGGRQFDDRKGLFKALDGLGLTEVAHGGAKGADTLAGDWAVARGVPVRVFKADWDGRGTCAGILRNIQMLDTFKPDAVVCFPGAKGTAHMASYGAKRGIQIIKVD